MEVGPTGYYIGAGASENKISFPDAVLNHIKKIKVPKKAHGEISKIVKKLKGEGHKFVQHAKDAKYWVEKCYDNQKTCERILKYAEV